MPTNPALNIRIAEAKGWTEIGVSYDGRLMGVPPGEKLLGYVPDWRGDAREFVPLLEEMARRPDVFDVELVTAVDDDTGQLEYAARVTRLKEYEELPTTCAAEPGHAVCLAWLAVNEAEEGGR